MLRNDTDRITFCQSKKRKHAWSFLIYFFPALATCQECKAVRACSAQGKAEDQVFMWDQQFSVSLLASLCIC